jgi:uncharacterized protein (DUF1697 family)
MPRYVAFLRAINVGGHMVKMDRLREIFAELGLSGVETFIASGNVLFESRAKPAALEARIERALHDALGYEVATFLRTFPELQAVVEALPRYDEIDLAQVCFLKEAPSAAARKALVALETPDFTFHFGAREFYWMLRVRQSVLRVNPKHLERAVGGPYTARSINTVQRLLLKSQLP